MSQSATTKMEMEELKRRIKTLEGRVAALEGRPTYTWTASQPRGVTFVPSVIDYGTAVETQFKGVT